MNTMINIRNFKFLERKDDISIERMEIDVDNASELPKADAFEGRKIAQGSIAFAINDKTFYAMNSDGEWVNQTGEEDESAVTASAKANTLNFVTTNLTDVKKPNASLFDGFADDVLTSDSIDEAMEETDGNALEATSIAPTESILGVEPTEEINADTLEIQPKATRKKKNTSESEVTDNDGVLRTSEND